MTITLSVGQLVSIRNGLNERNVVGFSRSEVDFITSQRKRIKQRAEFEWVKCGTLGIIITDQVGNFSTVCEHGVLTKYGILYFSVSMLHPE